jgi:scyllo-inositol 2-dehydrogenase (NADP+)
MRGGDCFLSCAVALRIRAVNSPINVGLVGFGMSSRVFHAPLISTNPALCLTHIVQRHGGEAAKAYPQATIVHDVDELFAHTDVHLVVVATPNPTHFEIASRALKAGKHVVVDKPFTISTAQADALIALSCEMHRMLGVFQNRRWDGDFLTVKQILENRLLGRVAEFESRYDRFRPARNAKAWREQALPGSGLLYDLGSHLLDQALVLFGRPSAIYAELSRQREDAVADDRIEVHLEYPQLRVMLKAGMLVCEPSPRFVLYGTQGSYLKYGLDPQEAALKSGVLPDGPDWGAEKEEAWGTHTRCDPAPQREKYPTLPGSYPSYYANIARALRGEEELAVKPEQARDVIRLIELAEQSNAEKRIISLS